MIVDVKSLLYFEVRHVDVGSEKRNG